MRRKRMVAWAAIVVIVVGAVVLACSGPVPTEGTEPPAAEGAGAAEASEGEALVAERCTECHSLARVERASDSREEWEQTVSRMVDKGANLTADAHAVVVDYLAETYGP